MSRRSAFLIILLMAAAHGLLAQSVYKSVGPDGKIVYTDKPPTTADTQSSVINMPSQAQMQVPPQTQPELQSPTKKPTPVSADAATSQGSKRATAKQAQRAEVPRNDAQAAPAASKVDPALEKAVIGVMGYEDLVRLSEDVCMSTLPTSFKKYNAATDGWKQRNAAILSQRQRVFSQVFNASERQQIEAGVKARTQQMFAPIVNAPTASKIKWCDQTVDELNKGAMDMHNKPNLSTPLMSYRSKQ
jgi:hypothetical protein